VAPWLPLLAREDHPCVTIEFPNTRWSLIARLAQDAGGHATLVELYAPAIARYLATRFPSENKQGILDDIVQEVLIDLIERPALFSSARPGAGSRFRYVVMNAAFLLARNARRRLGRRAHEEGATVDVEDAAAVPVDDLAAMDRAWAESVLTAAWNEVASWVDEGVLERGTVELLHDHLVQAAPLRDVAERAGLPLATCFRRVAKGRTYLQKAIIDRLERAGEIPAGSDATQASERLLAAVRPQAL
jgi:DNA-directed RNA polymerase specialized sigma24 family protein